MNLKHLKTMLWLRWTLSRNQWRRAGVLNLVLMIMIVCSAGALAISSFFLALGAGLIWLPKVTVLQFLLAWDALVVVFLLVWSVSLIVEIQRSEMLSLDRFLHLPVSLKGAFFLNYITSFISLGLLFFTCASVGICIAAVPTIGWRMLLLVPMIVAFIAMITAVTYQVRGWLVSLMSTKRRRQTVIAILTLGLILITQIPNVIIQVELGRKNNNPTNPIKALQELVKRRDSQEIDSATFEKEFAKIQAEEAAQRKSENEASLRRIEAIAVPTNLYLPIGWLPLASMELLKGRLWPSGLATLGMLVLACTSLLRTYSVTLRQFTQSGTPVGRIAKTKQLPGAQNRPRSLLDREFRLLDEPIATVTLASWIHLIRSPEAKLALIGPIIVLMFLFVIAATKPFPKLPAEAGGFVLLGGVALSMFIHLLMSLNIFGTDRSGFRSYVLMPIERRHILIGKNLALIPVFVGLSAVVFAGACYFAIPSLSILLASLLQLVVVFCGTSLVGNVTSTYFPMAIVPGTSKPANVSITTMAVQFGVTMFFPLVLVPAAAALGGEIALAHYAGIRYVPIYLIVSFIEAAACIWLYRRMIGWQGRLLQSRETKVLEVVNSHQE